MGRLEEGGCIIMNGGAAGDGWILTDNPFDLGHHSNP